MDKLNEYGTFEGKAKGGNQLIDTKKSIYILYMLWNKTLGMSSEHVI